MAAGRGPSSKPSPSPAPQGGPPRRAARPSLGRDADGPARRPPPPLGPRKLGEILIEQGSITEEDLARAFAVQLGVPYVDPDAVVSSPQALHAVPQHLAEALGALPLAVSRDGAVTCALGDPFDAETIEALTRAVGGALDLMVGAPGPIADAIAERYGDLQPLEEDGPDEPAPPDDLWLDDVLVSGSSPMPSPSVLADMDAADGVVLGGAGDTLPSEGIPAPQPPLAATSHAASPASPPSLRVPVVDPRPSGTALETLGQNTDDADEYFDPAAQEPEQEEAPSANEGADGESIELEPEDGLRLPGAVASMPALVARLTPDAGDVAWSALLAGWIGNGIRFGADRLRARFTDGGVQLAYRVHGAWAAPSQLPAWTAPPLRRHLMQLVGLGAYSPLDELAGRLLPLLGSSAEVRFMPTLAQTDRQGVDLELLVDRGVQLLALSDLGFSSDLQRRLRQWTAARQGLVLLTGPPGSGRTSTLLALAQALGAHRTTVVVGQRPAPPAATYTGVPRPPPPASSSRSIRRAIDRNPAVICADDVDDAHAARSLAEQTAAGRLIIATAAGTSARDVLSAWRAGGVPDPLLGEPLLGIVEHRLVRLLCRSCKVEGPLDGALATRLGLNPGTMPPHAPRRGPGCLGCHRTGFAARRPLPSRVELPGGVPLGVDDAELGRLVERYRIGGPADQGGALIGQGLTSLTELAAAGG